MQAVASEVDPTRSRLLDAAEQLFAAHGPDAVSLRAVMTAAGTNVAAVHYHFGSKGALLEAVLARHVPQVTADRIAFLDALAPDRDPTPRELADALVGPVARIAASGGQDWIRLVGRLLDSNDPALAVVSSTFFERNDQFAALMHRLDPETSPPTRAFRLTQAMTLTLRVLGDRENTRSLMAGSGDPWTDQDLLDQLLDVVTSVLAGPHNKEKN